MYPQIAKTRVFIFFIIINESHFYELYTKFYPTFFSLGLLHMQVELLRITSVDCHVIEQWLIIFSISVGQGRQSWIITVSSQLFIDSKEAYDSIRREEM
jgi:hypothetical protein